MEKKVLVPVADGTEELEAIAIIDVLRRAGAVVTVASVSGNRQITTSHDIIMITDALIDDCVGRDYDLVVLPGGIPGAENLRDSGALIELLKHQRDNDRLYGAVCASPALVLEHHGLLENRQATCHPAYVEQLSNKDQVSSRVVVDGNCITSQGAGTAVDFALALVEQLFGRKQRDEVAVSMVLPKLSQ
jgi:4-methyl-5(b-hydroxyethyl)-thiazole monophosphate biosynthesis